MRLQQDFIVCFFISLVMMSCAPKRAIVGTHEKSDSVRTEIRYERTVVIDTFYLEIPEQKQSNVTDTCYSFLKNEYAESEAWNDTTGMLHHTLKAISQRKPISVANTIVTRDSIIFKDRYQYKDRPVPYRAPLTWAQKAQIYGFRAMLVLSIAGILLKRLTRKRHFLKNKQP